MAKDKTESAEHTTETVGAEHGADHGGGGDSVLAPDQQMVLFTWLVFAVLLVILYKFALKPITDGLQAREEHIRTAMDEADQARKQLQDIESSRDAMISEADEKAKEIVSEARKAAEEAARVIKEKANADSQIMIENAQREIAEAENRARADLRKDSADLAISLAGKLVGENLDDDRNRALTDKLISEI